MTQPSAAVQNAAKRTQPPPSGDRLQALQQKAAEARDLELEIVELSERLKEKRASLNGLYFNILPSMLDEVKLDRIGVPPEGNKPGVDYHMRPYFSAGIAAKWSDEKKAEAFAFLKSKKAESLIKTEVSVALPKGNLPLAKKLFASINKLKVKGAVAELSQTVHSSTLTAWLREIYDRGQTLPQSDLDKIGGSVGRYVVADERRE